MTNEEFDKQGFCFEAKVELKDGKIYNLASVDFKERIVEFLDGKKKRIARCSFIVRVINK